MHISFHRIHLFCIVGVLFLLFLTIGCSSLQSGTYIKIREGDTLASISKAFNVPPASILNANRDKKWHSGEWFFIPLQRGLFPRVMGGNPLYADANYSTENFYKSIFLWPVPASSLISSRFGETRKGRSPHQGIDIPATTGEVFVAADDGEVIFSGYDRGGYGRMIIIRHKNGLDTIYGHASEQLIKAGEDVFRGQVIGLIGSTGRSSGPHLHFEVRRNELTLDPLHFVN